MERYLAGGFSRLHMPGHKGRGMDFLGEAVRYDLTEVTGLDSLYHPTGAIAGTEAAYTRLFGTAGSLLSAGGSTLCIQAMLALAAGPGERILASRGAHTAAVSAMALLDLRPVWLYPPRHAGGLAEGVTPGQVERALAAQPDIRAVYITSPTYYGVLSDIAGIAAVCRARGVPLLVDNAHGPHLRFLPVSEHPADLGADLCCDSLHKTLPVLTGGALLHVKNPAYLARAKERMALFGSTSPSYLILLSADAALDYLAGPAGEEIARVAAALSRLRELAGARGLAPTAERMDPLRLTLAVPARGGREAFAAQLARHRIEPEYLDDGFCVLMAGGGNTPEDFSRIEALLREAEPGEHRPPAALPRPARAVMTPREAVFAPREPVAPEAAAGRVSSGTVTPCPPGIPLLVPGERIDADFIPVLKNCGISPLYVVK